MSSPPAIGSDGTVYVGSWDGRVRALDGQTGSRKWEFKPGSAAYSSPAIGSDGTVYVGSLDKNVYALDGQDGARKWEFETGSRVSSPAIGSDGTVYVGSYDKRVYAIKTGSKGLAKSPWPMRGQNPQHTGRAPTKVIAPESVPGKFTEPTTPETMATRSSLESYVSGIRKDYKQNLQAARDELIQAISGLIQTNPSGEDVGKLRQLMRGEGLHDNDAVLESAKDVVRQYREQRANHAQQLVAKLKKAPVRQLAEGSYRFVFLPEPMLYPGNINNNGDMPCNRRARSAGAGVIRWSNGEVETLPTPSPNHYTSSLSISDSGIVVGVHWSLKDNSVTPFQWSRDRGSTGLPGMGGPQTFPRDVNNHGTVVGDGLNEKREWRGFVYRKQTGMLILGTLGGKGGSKVTAINEADVVVGIAAFRVPGFSESVPAEPVWSKRVAKILDGRSEAVVWDRSRIKAYRPSAPHHPFKWTEEMGMVPLPVLFTHLGGENVCSRFKFP